MHVVIDAVVIIVSYLLAWTLKFVGPFSVDAVRSLSFEWYMTALVGIVPVYLILYYAFNLYTPKRVQGRRLEFSNIVKANTVGILLIIGCIYVWLKEINFSRDMLFFFYFINMFLEELVRITIRYLLRDIRKRGLNQKHILLVGYSSRRKSGSASVSLFNSTTYGVCVASIPIFTALQKPVFSASAITRTHGYFSSVSSLLPSTEPLSTNITSNSEKVCRFKLSRQRSTYCIPLKLGITTVIFFMVSPSLRTQRIIPFAQRKVFIIIRISLL